jgi:hypothetical protein
VAYDLANDFVCAAVVGFGAGDFALEGLSAVLFELVEYLEVAALAVVELGGCAGWAQALALAFVADSDEIGQ